MKLSLYTFLFSEKDKFYVYNSETNFFSEIGSGLFEALYNRDWENIPIEILNDFKEKRIIVEESEYYNFYNETRLKFLARMYNPTSLNLVVAPTTDCNFACPYCFEPKKSPKYMTPEIIDDVCTFITNHPHAKDLNLTWYGGEPLLAIKQIETMLSRFSKFENIKLADHSLITNGFLLSDKAIKIFTEHQLSSIQITLDGVKSRHNTTRHLKKGNLPTFDVVYGNILKIIDLWPNTQVSIRVNIDKNSTDDYLAMQQKLQNDAGAKNNYSVYPGLIRRETVDACSLCYSSYTTMDLQNLYQHYKDKGAEINSFPQKRQKGCMIHAMYSYIIGPEGELYKCWNDVSDPQKIIGNIKQTEMTNRTLFLNYLNGSTPFDERCKNCKVFPICDGGCSLYRYRNNYEQGEFTLCCSYKNENVLKKVLLDENK